MKVEQVHELLKEIKGAYNRFEINEEMPRVWFKHFKDEDYTRIMNGLQLHIQSSRYEPTISDLLSSKLFQPKEYVPDPEILKELRELRELEELKRSKKNDQQ